MDKELFGARMQELRKQKNMTQLELGQLIGVTPTQIGDIERGSSTTSIPHLYKLCRFFGVSSDYMLGLTDIKRPYPRSEIIVPKEERKKLRYKINILAELKKAGYPTTRIRREKIIAESTLQRLRTGNTSLNLETFDVICKILHCQPGDLVEWVEDEE